VVHRRGELHRLRHPVAARLITLPLLWLGLLLNAAGVYRPALRVIGAAAGYLLLWGVFWLFKLVTARRDGVRRLQAARRDRRVCGWQVLPIA